MDIAAEKKRLRALALGRRGAMDAAERAEASRAAAARAQEAIGAAIGPVRGRVVALFSPFRDEIDTAPLATALRAAGAVTALPVIAGRGLPLLFRRWDAATPLVATGAFGIAEPSPEAAEVVPELVMVPLAAFDRRGFRIGYGAGFYDRTLAGLRARGPVTAIGLAFACQEVDAVPVEPHDEPVDMMVTEADAWRVRSPL